MAAGGFWRLPHRKSFINFRAAHQTRMHGTPQARESGQIRPPDHKEDREEDRTQKEGAHREARPQTRGQTAKIQIGQSQAGRVREGTGTPVAPPVAQATRAPGRFGLAHARATPQAGRQIHRPRALRYRSRPQRGELPGADAADVPRACRQRLPHAHGHRPRQTGIHLRAVLRPRPPPRLRARRCRHRQGRHGGG